MLADSLKDRRYFPEAALTNLHCFDSKQFSKFYNFWCNMIKSNRAMMRRAVRVPGIYELPGTRLEFITAICISNLKDRSVNRFAFSYEKRKFSIYFLNDRK